MTDDAPRVRVGQRIVLWPDDPTWGDEVKQRRWSTAVAIGITAAFVLGACGSDEKSTTTAAGATTTTPAGSSTTGSVATTTGGSSPTTGGTTASTAGTTPSVSTDGSTTPAGGLGLIDGVYKGSGGFELDPKDTTSTCSTPLLIKGLTSRMEGDKDAYVTEGGQMVQYRITDPKKLGGYVPVGDLINLEGKLGTYKTVQDAAASATTESTAPATPIT